MSKVAIAILNYNGAHHLQQFLPLVIKYAEKASIYVIDNASTDHSVEVLKAYPMVHVLRLEKNHGFAEGYNLGLKAIDAEYYVLLNSDIEVTDGWLNPMLNFLEEHSEYVVCQPKIMDYNKKDQFEYAGAAGGFIDLFGYPFCRGRIFDHLEMDNGQYNEPMDILWASGACLMIRSKSFHGLGGLDRDFFAHMEEIDLCWRIYSSGYKARCIPQSVVYHIGGGTLQYGSTYKTYLNFRNGLVLLLKNLPLLHLPFVLPSRLILDMLAGIQLGIRSHLPEILKAHFHFYRSFFYNFNKRTKTKAPSRSLKGYKFLVFAFFIRKKKQFSEI